MFRCLWNEWTAREQKKIGESFFVCVPTFKLIWFICMFISIIKLFLFVCVFLSMCVCCHTIVGQIEMHLIWNWFYAMFAVDLFIFTWAQEINYDSPRGGVSVITEKGEVTTSYLLIQKAKISDSGIYKCQPTHANPNTVNVHVLNGTYSKILPTFNSLTFTLALTCLQKQRI